MPGKTIGKSLLIAGLALGASMAMAADPATMTGASGTMLANTCAGCHGTHGNSVGPASPTIAGASKDYLIETMQGFKSGDIPGTIMGRIAAGYSDEEIMAMADVLSKQTFAKAQGQKFDADKAKKGAKLHDKYCEKCHAEGGTSAEDDSGILAGQWTPYLEYTIADFRAGHREAPKKMGKKLKQMEEKYGEAAFDLLFNYYASQQ